ncbi:MAG TPA: hypothetical protein ENK57_21475 [Polyangiaceae bacterium]|nr:hypothetical protein [Polyangiaceae bacterium]
MRSLLLALCLVTLPGLAACEGRIERDHARPPVAPIPSSQSAQLPLDGSVLDGSFEGDAGTP